MKNLFFLVSMLVSFWGFAQEPTAAKLCICRNGNFINLPSNISGPKVVTCGKEAIFSIANCPNAKYSWTILPNQKINGQGTNKISFYPSNTGTFNISVNVTCGTTTKKIPEQPFFVKVNSILNCKADFVITQDKILPNGLYSIVTTPSLSKGFMHYWYLREVDKCESTTAKKNLVGIVIDERGQLMPAGSSPYFAAGSGFKYDKIAKGVTYHLIHYISCCGLWRQQTHCIYISPSQPILNKTNKVEFTKVISTGEVATSQLPTDLQKVLQNN